MGRACGDGGPRQVCRALFTNACVAEGQLILRSVGTALCEIGQLMNDHVRPEGPDGARQSLGVEDIHDDRFDPCRAQLLGLLR